MWRSLVVFSLFALIISFGYLLFKPGESEIKSEDPLEALLQQPAEDIRPLTETGSGALAIKEASPSLPVVEAVNEVPLTATETAEKAHVQGAAQLDHIERELAGLPGGSDSAPTRAMLLNSAAALNLDDQGLEQVHEIAMDELLQASESEIPPTEQQSSSFSFFLPVLAHEVALKTAFDGNEAMNITIDGLSVHTDPSVRYSLVRQFVTRYPNLEPQLREELYYRNINAQLQSQ